MSNTIDPRARQIITNANGDIIKNTLESFNNALPPVPTAQNLGQDFTHPLTPSAQGGGNKENPPALREGKDNALEPTQNLAQNDIAQNPIQSEQTRYARDIDSTPKPSTSQESNKAESSEYKRPTFTKTYSLNKYIINDIDADNADQALDLLRNTPTNISWEGVDNALKNGISSSQILERFADISEQNPRALWISLEREAQDSDYVKKASQTSGITQKEHKQVEQKTLLDSLSTSALGDMYSFLAEKFPSLANKDISQIIEQARGKNNALDSNIQAAIQNGQSYDEFVAKNGQDGINAIKDTMDIYRGEADENFFSQSIDGLVSLVLPINTYTDSQAKKEYESRQKEYELYHKPLDEWNESDYTFMRYRKDDLWDKISSTFTGQGDEAKKQALANEWKKEYENKQNKIFSNDLKKALLYFENVSQATSVAEVGKNAIDAAFSKELKHDKEKLALHNKNLSTLARSFGFDEAFLDTKTHKTIFVKGEEAWEASPDAGQIFSTMLKANIGTMAGGTAGAIATAKAFAKGGSLKTKAIAGLGGAALGSFLGAGLDVKLENFINNRESNFDEMLAHMTQEGLLAVATPLALSGAAKTLKGGAKAIAKVSQATGEALTKGTLNKSAKGFIDSSKAVFGKILDYTPMGNVIKNIADGNATAVRRLMNATIPKEEREALRASIKDFGLELELNPKSAQALESLSAKYGDKHPRIIQAAQTVHNAFSLPSGKAIQEELLSAMRADNTGSLYGFLVEVANQTPQLQKSLHEILNQTHARALRELRAVGASPSDIKAVFDSYKQGVEEGYAKSFEVLSDIFSKDITTTIDKSAYQALTNELKENVIDPAALNYLKVVEKRIYENNRSFDNLKDALSLLNEQWKKHAKNLGFSGEKLRRVEKQMRDDIKRGIYDLFEQMPHARDFRELFDTALRDYSTMKGLMGDIKDLKLQSTKIEFEKSLDKLFNFLKAGQSDTLESISNLKLLTQNLPQEAKIKFEVGVLNHLMEKSVFSAKNGDNVVLEVFNSGAFLERLEQIKGGFSTSQAAQYIDFVKDFHKLYKNDYLIGTRTLDPAIIKKAGGGIATTPEGRFAYQRAKFIYENILRLMPAIPFLRTFNESVSGAAVRFHLKSALQKSASVGELRRSLDFKIKNGNFNNATKEVLAKITKEVDEGAQNIARAQAQEVEKEAQNQANQAQSQNLGTNPQATHADNAITPPASAEGDTGGGLFDLPNTPQTKTIARNTIAEQNEMLKHKDFWKQYENGDIVFLDKSGKKHILESEVQDKWLETFGLESITQDFMPKIPSELKNALGKDIKLKMGSLYKLVAQGREEFIPQIKQVLESPEVALKDSDSTILLAKHLKDEDYFVNVSVDKDEAFISISNGIKEANNLKNKLEAGAEVIYQSPNANSNLQTLLQGSRYSPNKIDEKIIQNSTQNNPKSILESVKNAKQAQKEAKELAQKQADEEFYARYNAEKARQEAVLAQRESSEGLSDLAAHEANFSFEADIPTKQLQSTTIALNKDEIYPAHFVIVDKDDLKPRFSKGNFQFKQGMKADEVQSVANDFKPELLFEKSGEYEGLPLIARDGQIIAGNHRAQGIKDFSQESLKKHQEYAKAKFGVELADNEVIVRQIDKDVPLHTQLRLAQASNEGNANNRLGEQILAEVGKAQPYIEKLPSKIQADSFEALQSAVANALNMPNAQEAANRALFAHLAKGTGSKDLISILDKPRNNALNDLIKAQELYFKNAGEFYNLHKNTALNPELNLNDYLLQALDSTLSLAGKERGQVFKELSDDINDFLATGGALGNMISNEAQIKTLKGRVLGAGIAKYANQIEGGASQLNKVLRDLPAELAEEFSPSLTNPSGKALKDVDMYDFLDYFIRVTKHNNNSVQELAQSLQALREFERGKVPPPSTPNPPSTHADNVKTTNAEGHAQISPSYAEGDTGGGFDLARLKELESSLDYRFENKFRKQAEQELGKDLDIDKIDNALKLKTITSSKHSRLTKEINEDYAKWFDTQRDKGNKEILQYDKDLVQYRKLHNDFYKKLIEAKNKAENKQAHLQWLDSYKPQMTGKTDEEIIATEIKKPKSTSKGKKEYFTYDEGKASLKTLRQRLEKALDLHPLAEFGTNYAEFYQDGKGAIAKLIAEANAAKQAGKDFSGQVASAFSKEIDGAEASIDLVWGKITNAQTHEGYGLAHIIDKHPELDLNLIPQIIERGKVEKAENGRITIVYNNFRLGIKDNWKGQKLSNKWIVTGYEKRK